MRILIQGAKPMLIHQDPGQKTYRYLRWLRIWLWTRRNKSFLKCRNQDYLLILVNFHATESGYGSAFLKRIRIQDSQFNADSCGSALNPQHCSFAFTGKSMGTIGKHYFSMVPSYRTGIYVLKKNLPLHPHCKDSSPQSWQALLPHPQVCPTAVRYFPEPPRLNLLFLLLHCPLFQSGFSLSRTGGLKRSPFLLNSVLSPNKMVNF